MNLFFIFHISKLIFFELGRYWDDFGTNLSLELIDGLRIANVQFALQMILQIEFERSQIWKFGWPINVIFESFPHAEILIINAIKRCEMGIDTLDLNNLRGSLST